ncbi:MAG: hypothetical protein R3B96_25560, partial [Pirellulaceae bacterium]
ASSAGGLDGGVKNPRPHNFCLPMRSHGCGGRGSYEQDQSAICPDTAVLVIQPRRLPLDA